MEKLEELRLKVLVDIVSIALVAFFGKMTSLAFLFGILDPTI